MKSNSLPRGFTLVEMIASTALIAVMAYILMSITQQAANTWRSSQAKVDQFRQARAAFEGITRRLSQATLNPHWDYQYAPDDLKKERPPIAYVRQSYLRFRSGPMDQLAPGGSRPTHGVFFQAPLGDVDNDDYENLERLLNTTGYFLEVADERERAPGFLRDSLPPKIRSRLMELRKPAEKLAIYQLKAGQPDDNWFQKTIDEPARPVRVLAKNILTLVIQPTLSQAEEVARKAAGKKILCPKFDLPNIRGIGIKSSRKSSITSAA